MTPTASTYVCLTCGLSVRLVRSTWKHSSGGGNPRTPRHRRHAPVVMPREEYDRAFALDTPPEEARAILARYR